MQYFSSNGEKLVAGAGSVGDISMQLRLANYSIPLIWKSVLAASDGLSGSYSAVLKSPLIGNFNPLFPKTRFS
jgi:hypothetical protein